MMLKTEHLKCPESGYNSSTGSTDGIYSIVAQKRKPRDVLHAGPRGAGDPPGMLIISTELQRGSQQRI